MADRIRPGRKPKDCDAHAFWKSDRGGVAVAFALAAITLLGAIGLAIDYASAVNARSMLQNAADSAALAAAADADYSEQQVLGIVEMMVNGNGNIPFVSALESPKISRTAGVVEVELWGTVDTTFANLFGVKSVPVAVSAKAGSAGGATDIYVAMDMSASMGLGADPVNRKGIMDLTKPYIALSAAYKNLAPNGCEFACHSRQGWEPAGTNSYDMARGSGILMREDVMMDSFTAFVTDFLGAKTAAPRRVGVIGFSDDAQQLLAPSSNVSTVKQAPYAFPAGSRKNTKFFNAIPSIAKIVGRQGTGTTASPKKVIMLITDGAQYTYFGSAKTALPIDPALCQAIKDTDIKIAVLEVKYQENPGDKYWDAYVAPVYEDLSPALKECASDGMYFVSDDSDNTALSNAFKSVALAFNSSVVLIK